MIHIPKPILLVTISTLMASAFLVQADDVQTGIPGTPPATLPLPARLKFTVCPETTVITKPLRDDGTVDYAAAVNEQYRQGITTENNAGVILLKVMGTNLLNAEDYQERLKLLGLTIAWNENVFFNQLPGTGTILGVPGSYSGSPPNSEEVLKAQAEHRFRESYYTAQIQPWRSAENSRLADWVKLNKEPLDLLRQIRTCPRFYLPLIIPDTGMANSGADYHNALELVLSAASARAMMAVASGDYPGFEADILAVLYTCRLLMQGFTLEDRLRSANWENRVCLAIQNAASSGKLGVEDCGHLRQTLTELPKAPDLAQHYRQGFERYGLLDQVAHEKNYAQLLTYIPIRISKARKPGFTEALSHTLDAQGIDGDALLREINHRYDAILDLITEQDWPHAQAQLAQIQAKYFHPHNNHEYISELTTIEKTAGESDEHLARRLMVNNLLAPFIERLTAQVKLDFRTRMMFELTQVSLTLAMYRAEQGTYPDTLKMLCTKHYLMDMPQDLYSGKDLLYHLTPTGYTLYSVGENGKDDDGLDAFYKKDDVVVRVGDPPAEFEMVPK